MSPAGRMHIGEIAERVGLSLRTVRYYEEQGLIEPDGRTDGGFRLYTETEVARLRVIMEMKPLGFSIPEMREVLDARDAGAGDVLAAYAERAAERAAGLREKAARGEAFAAELRVLADERSARPSAH